MAATAPYVELHAHSAFSFLDGASTPTELAGAAAALGYPAMALDRPRRDLGVDGVRPRLQGAGSAADHRRRADRRAAARRAARACPPHPPGRDGGRLPQPLPAAHRRPLPHPRGRAAKRRAALGAAGGARRARRGPGLPERLRPRRRAGRALGARRALAGGGAGPRAARRLRGASGCGSSCSAPTSATTAPATAGSPALAERLGVPCVASGNVHCHAPLAAPGCRTPSSPCATASGWRSPSRCGAATPAPRSPRREAMAAASPSTPRRLPRRRGWPSALRFDLTDELGYRYPGAEDAGADRKLAEPCRALLAERYAGSPDRRRGRAAPARRSWR